MKFRGFSRAKANRCVVDVLVASTTDRVDCKTRRADWLRARCPVPVTGLMTMPPWDPDPETARPHFTRLRQLLAATQPTDRFSPRHLSMGMSHDFEVAIEEGATIVRVGTALFGAR